MNSIYLSGRIQTVESEYETHGETFSEMLVEVKRLSGQVDIIPVTISQVLLPDACGPQISLLGEIRTYNNKKEDSKKKLVVTVFTKELVEGTTDRNEVELTGFICKPPLYRQTPLKREICDVILAVNRAFDKSDYIPLVIWGRSAKFASKLPVGSRVSIKGRLQSREYEKVIDENTTEKRVAYEVSVSSISLADEDKAE